jgi:hypothetical protein
MENQNSLFLQARYMPKSNYGEIMITEKNIKTSINKHFLKAIVIIALMTLLVQFINGYFFNDAEFSPLLIILFSISGCLYIFQKVLLDLFKLQNTTNEP